MKQAKDEKGYALILVLFAIVLISVITAVFMKGSMNNNVQEKTVDENNLVVVAAEAGLDYYKWGFDEAYRNADLAGKFDLLANSLPKERATREEHNEIRLDLAEEFIEMLNEEAQSMIGENAKKLNDQGSYTHKLISATILPINRHEFTPDKSIFIYVQGKVEGEITNRGTVNNNDNKILNFMLNYEIPPVKIKDPDIAGGNSGVENPPQEPGDKLPDIQSPEAPADPLSPAPIVGVQKQADKCKSSTINISGAKCNASGSNESGHNIKDSQALYVEGSLDSWGTVNISNSFVNVTNKVSGANLTMDGTELTVKNGLDFHASIKIKDSKLNIDRMDEKTPNLSIINSQVNVARGIRGNPTYFANAILQAGTFHGGDSTFNDVNFTVKDKLEVQSLQANNSNLLTNSFLSNSSNNNLQKVNLRVVNNFKSGGANFTDSKLNIGGTLDTGGGLFYAKNSSVTIDGNADTHNGSTLEDSKLSIKGNYTHTSKAIDAKNTDVFVGGNMTATNGTNFDNVKMIVNGRYDSSTRFYINNTHLKVGEELWMGNGGTFEGSQLSAGDITSRTTVDFKDAVVYAGTLKSDVMKMTSSKVCVTNLDVRSLTMDHGSEIYYSNTSNQTGVNIFKVPAQDFNENCGAKYDGAETQPEIPGTEDDEVEIVPKPPVLESVEY